MPAIKLCINICNLSKSSEIIKTIFELNLTLEEEEKHILIIL